MMALVAVKSGCNKPSSIQITHSPEGTRENAENMKKLPQRERRSI